ncbi:MAG: hypothetical protein JWL87_566 [Candidatus Adlerbacteria bacterium]|nr:hypothetical protein [Candidatus Adlerbacteria bacterium]
MALSLLTEEVMFNLVKRLVSDFSFQVYGSYIAVTGGLVLVLS